MSMIHLKKITKAEIKDYPNAIATITVGRHDKQLTQKEIDYLFTNSQKFATQTTLNKPSVINYDFINNVTEKEYLDSKKIVELYEKQQQAIIERFESGDLDLLTVLSNGSKNALIKHNQYEWVKKRKLEIRYISDVVKLINETGNVYALCKLRHLGKKRYNEIMTFVRPFL